MRTDLMSRGFKREMVCLRAEPPNHITISDYKKTVNKAISVLPKDLKIEEIVLESSIHQKKKHEFDIQTIIYWREP